MTVVIVCNSYDEKSKFTLSQEPGPEGDISCRALSRPDDRASRCRQTEGLRLGAGEREDYTYNRTR